MKTAVNPSYTDAALARLKRVVERGTTGPDLQMYAAEALLYGVPPDDVRNLLGLDDLGMKRVENVMQEFAADDAEAEREAARHRAQQQATNQQWGE